MNYQPGVQLKIQKRQQQGRGSAGKRYMRNLLYYHTKPFDVVFDPFAGSGTTVDACKEMLRRFYCSDIHVRPRTLR